MPSSTLYRLAGFAGIASGFLLLVNIARRGGLIPETALTQGIAPLASVLGLFALTGLYLWQRRAAGVLGLIGYALNFAGMAGVLGVEIAIHYVLAYLDEPAVTALLDGPTGIRFLAIAMLFLAGVVTFGVATWRAGVFPRVAAALYIVGLSLVAVRSLLPEPVVGVAGLLGAGATAWLAAALWRAAGAEQSSGSVPALADRSPERP